MYSESIMKKSLVLVLISMMFFGARCRKAENSIPYVPIDITININQPAYFNLTAINGYENVVGGSMGLIVYRKGFDEFIVYERHAPFNVSERCQVNVLEDGITIEDPCSGSQWLIIDGSILKGPAINPLLQYGTTYTNPFLRIYN